MNWASVKVAYFFAIFAQLSPATALYKVVQVSINPLCVGEGLADAVPDVPPVVLVARG
jgi:hypothetical protein